MLNLEIPEGYTVDELPSPISIVTSDKSAHFRFAAQVMGNRIQIINSWGVKKTFYAPESFHELKEFYALLVSKQSEQIVLKKTNTDTLVGVVKLNAQPPYKTEIIRETQALSEVLHEFNLNTSAILKMDEQCEN
jgi:hypothetical protein